MNLYVNVVNALPAGVTEASLATIIKDVLATTESFPINDRVKLQVMHQVLAKKEQIAERVALLAKEQILATAKTERFDAILTRAVDEWLDDCGFPTPKEEE